MAAEEKVAKAEAAGENTAEMFTGLPFVVSAYVAFGQPGIERLSRDIRRRGHSPLLDTFAAELYDVLSGTRPVPTELINESFAEAGVEVEYSRSELLAELNALWEQLDLQAFDEDPAEAAPAAEDRPRSNFMFVRGDPVEAFRTWMSWRLLAVLALGVAIVAASWEGFHATHGLLRGLLAVSTMAGFLIGGSAGALLALRRNGYQNPDAVGAPPRLPGIFRRPRG